VERDGTRERELAPDARVAVWRSERLLDQLGWTSFYDAPDASCSWPIPSSWVTLGR